ncbi:MAG TPA: glycosyltransferase, partial [Acidimicrobiia bacterium]
MLTIVMPAHNEAGFLETAVRDVTDGLRVQDRPFELLLIENGSTDGTPALADRLARAIPEMSVHTLRAADYGEALRTGLLTAEGDVVVVFDVDYYDLDFLACAVEELEHTDAAI